jgi:4-diphosphocytidyl-2C-methyl-D-erythritol kinase
LPVRAAWIVVPPVMVSTADAYRWVDEHGLTSSPPPVAANELEDWGACARIASNDFEIPVSAHVPMVQAFLAALRVPEFSELLGPDSIVVMSGSGSAILIVAGDRPPIDMGAAQSTAGVTILETETASFVEPVVLTH